MRLAKVIHLIWIFYKNFIIVSLLIQAVCLALFWKYGYSIFFGLFWFKIITSALIYYFINTYKKNEYYYYFNLGVTKFQLWTTCLIMDFALFIILLKFIDTIR